jgi:hypothetical protein
MLLRALPTTSLGHVYQEQEHGARRGVNEWFAWISLLLVALSLVLFGVGAEMPRGRGHLASKTLNASAAALLRSAPVPETAQRRSAARNSCARYRIERFPPPSLPRQFDEWIWFDETRAIEPPLAGARGRNRTKLLYARS